MGERVLSKKKQRHNVLASTETIQAESVCMELITLIYFVVLIYYGCALKL